MTASFVPPIRLDPRSKTPLYRQIAVWFQRAIVGGQLRPGQRVPSTRALAGELKISRIPVLSAYELLMAEGYLRPFIGAGTCVSESIPSGVFGPARQASPRATQERVETGSKRRTSRRAAGMPGPAQQWLEKARGCVDLTQFPAREWTRLVNRHARTLSRDVWGYKDPMGYWPFREAVAEYLGASRGVKCDPSQVLVTTGSQQGVQIAALALLDPRDPILIEEPCYPGAQQALKAAGARLIPIPVDGEGMNVASAIERAGRARVALVTPSHQFPMGVTMSAARRLELLAWAGRCGAWILEDDYDSEFRFGGNPIGSLQGIDSESRVIYIGTLSKVLAPALRLGFVVIPQDLVRSFMMIKSASDTFSPLLYQQVMTDFIREGHFAHHLKRMRSLYAEKRALLRALLQAEFGDTLEIAGEEAGMLLVALLPPGVNDHEIVVQAHQNGIAVGSLSPCYVSAPKRNGLVLNYADLCDQQIRETVVGLKKIILASAKRTTRT
ncbi:MAG TPA: PLP-dependent aminotransferase family protein [Steroidobacteraceae bacterium]